MSLRKNSALPDSAGRPLYLFVVVGLLAILVLSLLSAVGIGSVPIPIGQVYRVIVFHVTEWVTGHGVGDAALYGSGSMSDIVWFVRLPRLVLSLGVGGCLAVSGAIMQATVKNPMADPYILGISSGASFGATLAILFGVGHFLGAGFVGVMAFAGAFAVSMGVIGLANLGGRASPVKLVLAGTALSAICGAMSNFLLYVINTNRGAMEAVMRWSLGSLASATWSDNLLILSVSAFGLFFFWSQHRALNLMLLGDDAAATLGMSMHGRRILYLIVSSVLVGFAVYTAGIIGFVGLIIPHAVRMFFGNDHKKLIPIASLTGSIFLLWADVLCRVIIPRTELPIGILTSMVGAPVFIYLMARKRYGFGD